MYCSNESKFKPACMFGGVLQCGSNFKNPTKIVCDLHLDNIFGIKHTADRLTGLMSGNEITLNKCQLSRQIGDNNIFLPFPYILRGGHQPQQRNALNRFQEDDYISNGNKLCIVQEVSQTVNNILYSSSAHKLYPHEKLDTIRDIIIFWISGGSVVNCASEFNSSLFMEFYTRCRRGLINYWKGYEATIFQTTANVGVYYNFEVSKLPIFYQAMFQNIEMSNTTHINGTPLATIPNALINADIHGVQVFNYQERNVYIKSENSTWATPLILFGRYHINSRSPYTLFTRPPPTNIDNNFVSAPGRCD